MSQTTANSHSTNKTNSETTASATEDTPGPKAEGECNGRDFALTAQSGETVLGDGADNMTQSLQKESKIPSRGLLHIIVIGFHHKKGCQVEFSYPPLVAGTGEESGEVPVEWKHLPTLALPDGAHNYSKDTVYFHLKNRKGPSKATVYGVSCYRQIDAKDVVNKTEDITRGTIQKSVCVLTTLPCFGAIAAKLELVTHAWFDQKDFTQLGLLRDAYDSLACSLSSITIESQVMMGLNIHDVVKLYRHKLLVLFKLIMLERKTVFFMTPVCDLCNVILSLISLFPGLLEVGLVESVQNTKTPLISPTMKERRFSSCPDDEPYIDIHYTDTQDSSTSSINKSSDLVSETPDDKSVQNSVHNTTSSVGEKHAAGDTHKIQDTVLCAQKGVEPSQLKLLVNRQASDGVLELDSADALLQIDMEDQETNIWDKKPHSLSLSIEEDSPSPVSSEAVSNTNNDTSAARKKLTIEIPAAKKLELVPVVSPTSISIDKCGLPLAIFTKGSVCHPYLSLSYYDILEDVNIRSFVIGASNVLFKQKRHNIDVLVEKYSDSRKDEPGGLTIMDKELQKQLQLTTEDLRFADMISKRVDETVASGEFLEATEWEGGDEWIRAQFKDYLQSLMATVLAEDVHLLEAFNVNFVNAWKSTHNYKVWRNTVQQLEDVIPGHPCQGGVTLNDVKLQLARSERGRKINAVVGQAGKAMTDTSKAVGGAINNAKSIVSSWWSGIGSLSQSDDSNTTTTP